MVNFIMDKIRAIDLKDQSKNYIGSAIIEKNQLIQMEMCLNISQF